MFQLTILVNLHCLSYQAEIAEWCDISFIQVGIFPKFSGEEFENFNIVAETLRSDYDFGHTQDATHLPRGEAVSKPTLRLFKPFDELFVDTQVFTCLLCRSTSVSFEVSFPHFTYEVDDT